MNTFYNDQRSITISEGINLLLEDKRSQNCTPKTVRFYHEKLFKFHDYCQENDITHIGDVSPAFLRRYLLHLQETGHNQGGVHANYRALKTYFIWIEEEFEDFNNPVRKVKTPHVPKKILDPIPFEDIHKLLEACPNDTVTGTRDRAIIFALLDTGARAAEFVSMQTEDLNVTTGSIKIRNGKGQKDRIVFLGKKARRELRKYLKEAEVPDGAIWVTNYGTPLTYPGLRQIMRRRAELAGIPVPSLHAFRRTFALNCLRNGMDVFSLQRLMGHADLQVLRQYLAQTEGDIHNAHQMNSPVDRSF